MEIINIEAKTFNEMLSVWEKLKLKLEGFEKYIPNKGSNQWLNSKEVCKFLRISQRTLQNLRNNQTIAFTKTEDGIRYKKQDVISLLTMINKRK